MGPDSHYAKTAVGFASALTILEEEVHAASGPVHATVRRREIPVSASVLFDACEKSVEAQSIGGAIGRRVGGNHE